MVQRKRRRSDYCAEDRERGGHIRVLAPLICYLGFPSRLSVQGSCSRELGGCGAPGWLSLPTRRNGDRLDCQPPSLQTGGGSLACSAAQIASRKALSASIRSQETVAPDTPIVASRGARGDVTDVPTSPGHLSSPVTETIDR